MVTVKVSGVDKCIREFDRKQKGVEEALTTGTEDAADYLVNKIQSKFGSYQPGWAKLKVETIWREKIMGFTKNASKPLLMTEDLKGSFYTQTAAKTRKHVVWIKSDDPKLLHHMYGAPAAGVPKRDPVRPTVKDETKNALQAIRDAVKEALDG